MRTIRSDLVVISWWSNCLGLACLHNLVNYTRNRNIYFVQVGKPEEQKGRFRAHLPLAVKELPYPASLPAEHCKLIETIARDLLHGCDGLWFFDHDFFVFEDLEPWLANMDRELGRSACCLCHLQPADSPSITSPAFWLSPARFPEGMPGFEPVPYRQMKVSQRPDLVRAQVNLRMPEKDTLVLIREFLAERDMVCGFSLQSFPQHDHLGSLYMFAGEIPPEPLRDWMEDCVERFTAFYTACPPAWVSIEDPVLMQRLEEFRQAVSGGV
jgi:hypothetical protein